MKNLGFDKEALLHRKTLKFIEKLAKSRTSDEMVASDYEAAEFESIYNRIIKDARKSLQGGEHDSDL